MARTTRTLQRTRSVRPTARGWVSLAAGVLVLVTAYGTGWGSLLVVACAAFALPLIGLLVVALGRQRLEVVRAFTPAAVAVGDTVRVSVAVRNRGQRATLPGSWNDALPWSEDSAPQPLPSLAPAGLPLDVPLPNGRERAPVFRYDLHPTVRGVFPVGPLVVEHTDPFGMARAVTAQGESDELMVIPAAVPMPGGALSVADAEGSALLVHRRVTGNEDDLTTREYRAGDALRRVHWRASAKHGELMVRQEEERSFPEARIVVDTRRDGYPDAETVPYAGMVAVESDSFEWVVRMLASLGVHLGEAGFRVAIRETAPTQVAPFAERWEGGRAEAPFLMSLASIELDERPRGETPKSNPGGTGPVFAILGTPSEVVLSWLQRQRRPGEAAVAFVNVAGQDRRANDLVRDLRGSGWLVVPAEGDVDPADAWAAAHLGWGAIRGAR